MTASVAPPARLKRPVFAANWKMHLGPAAAAEYVSAFLARHAPRADRSVVLFPPAVSVSTVVGALSAASRADVVVGVQNIHAEPKGAFTGETSAVMASEAGARVALVGHSERRHVFGESDEETARKCAAALGAGLAPMLCVGEKLEEREEGRTEEVVLRQLDAALRSLPASALRAISIAYEPVWAIGTGRTATPGDASVVHVAIRRALTRLAGPDGADIPILYGGSVNAANASALLDAEGVDGLLVGGASLDPEGWSVIAGT